MPSRLERERRKAVFGWIGKRWTHPGEGESDRASIESELTAILAEAAHAVLDALYPGVLEERSRG